jgi:aquaporin NIP
MLKKILSEFAGAFFLVFAGTGAIVINQETNGVIGHAGIAMVFGVIVAAMIYSFGNISGAHMNPAVTIALYTNGTIPLAEVPAYIIAQLTGAFTASVTLKWFFPLNKLLGTTLPYNDSWKMAFGMEFILTFLLVFVIFRVIANTELKVFAGVIIGGVVFLDAMFGGPVCGASMNPARSIAPAVVSGVTEHLWAYIVSPIVAGLAASIIHQKIFKQKNSE